MEKPAYFREALWKLFKNVLFCLNILFLTFDTFVRTICLARIFQWPFGSHFLNLFILFGIIRFKIMCFKPIEILLFAFIYNFQIELEPKSSQLLISSVNTVCNLLIKSSKSSKTNRPLFVNMKPLLFNSQKSKS